MTVAVVVKVFDGLVLATDSATTLSMADGSSQVWNNANKVFHLHRKFPVGAMTWGLGNIGGASISTIAKELRRRFMGKDPDRLDWELNDGYTVEQVADRLIEMVYDELFSAEFKQAAPASPLGFLVAGFSGRDQQSEAWLVEILGTAERPTPVLLIGKDQFGYQAFAQPEATDRLFLGYDTALQRAIQSTLEPAEWDKVKHFFEGAFMTQPAVAPMPLADAISLARYLVDVTAGYSRYRLGPDTVGGPVEVAGISRHEGYKWISRKHYYSPELNPEEPSHEY